MLIQLLNLIRTVETKQAVPIKHVAGDVYEITYIHEDRLYKLFFPIRNQLKSSMRNTDVFIKIKDTSVEISQQPGVPYIIQPNDFCEGASITVFREDDDLEKTFLGAESIVW